MKRRRISIVLGSVTAVIAVLCGIAAALWHTPAFYEESLRADASASTREQQAKKFVQLATQLESSIQRDDRWTGEFTQDQINGFLAHDLPQRYSELIPQQAGRPRVRLADGAIDLAFRYRHGWWNGTVHVRLRPYVLGPSQLALDVRTVRAGAVPIPVSKPLDEIVREMRKSGWLVQWRPTKEGELLVIDLKPEIAAKLSLDGIELQDGVLRFAGHRPSPEVVAARSNSMERLFKGEGSFDTLPESSTTPSPAATASKPARARR